MSHETIFARLSDSCFLVPSIYMGTREQESKNSPKPAKFLTLFLFPLFLDSYEESLFVGTTETIIWEGILMTAEALVSQCHSLGVLLAVSPEWKLRATPPGRLPETLKERLRQRKAE